MATPTGNIPQKYIWEFPGDPTNVGTSVINPPKGALIISTSDGAWYRKTTGYGDNSGYSLVLSGTDGMLKSVYDPQNAGYISGDTEGSNQGGLLSMDAGAGGIGGSVTTYGTDSGAGGSISTNGGSSLGATGGSITTSGGTESGGSIDTSSKGGHAGGSIDASGGSTDDGGDITTANGGGSINTAGSGSIEFGAVGTRTTVNGSAAEGDKTITLPNLTGTVALTSQITLAAIETAAAITPCTDGTVTPVNSITTKGGIITAIS